HERTFPLVAARSKRRNYSTVARENWRSTESAPRSIKDRAESQTKSHRRDCRSALIQRAAQRARRVRKGNGKAERRIHKCRALLARAERCECSHRESVERSRRYARQVDAGAPTSARFAARDRSKSRRQIS